LKSGKMMHKFSKKSKAKAPAYLEKITNQQR